MLFQRGLPEWAALLPLRMPAEPRTTEWLGLVVVYIQECISLSDGGSMQHTALR